MDRCLIVFFGITRGLEWTIDSIERNIFSPIREAGMEQVRIAHFNVPKTLQSPRSGEETVQFKLGDVDRLQLDKLELEDQSEEKIADYFSNLSKVPYRGEGDEGGSTRRNSLFQMYSLYKSVEIMKSYQMDQFDCVILLRPDLEYLDPLPIRQLLSRLKTGNGLADRFKVDVLTPSWQKYGGLNDRFAIATPSAAVAYASRIAKIPSYCRQFDDYQTERFLRFAMREDKIRNGDIDLRARRIRSDGQVKEEDFSSKWNARIKHRIDKVRALAGR